MDDELWQQLLKEADKNGDGAISFDEFSETMQEMIRKSWLRPLDRSPSKSPTKFSMTHISGPSNENSPLKLVQSTPSPGKKKRRREDGKIISPAKGNPFS